MRALAEKERETLTSLMRFIYRDNPSFWPHGLALSMFDDAEVIKTPEGTPAGFVGWQEFPHKSGVRVGYYSVGVLPWYRGKGYAKKALRGFIESRRDKVDHVRALIEPHNEPSKALAKSLGIPHGPSPDSFDFTTKAASVIIRGMQSKSAGKIPWSQLLAILGGGTAGYVGSKIENPYFGYGHNTSGINTLSNVLTGMGAGYLRKNPKALIGLGTAFTGKQIATNLAHKADLATDAFVKDAPLRHETAILEKARSAMDAARSKAELAATDPDFNRKAIVAALSTLGIVGAGGLGLYAYNSLKGKAKKPAPTGNTRTAPGSSDVDPRKSKVHITVPWSAFPPEFYRSLQNADDRPSAVTKNLPVPA